MPPKIENPIDFNKIKWGSFSNQFAKYHSKHPNIKTLSQFANYIIKHKEEFTATTFKRAEFYKNVLK